MNAPTLLYVHICPGTSVHSVTLSEKLSGLATTRCSAVMRCQHHHGTNEDTSHFGHCQSVLPPTCLTSECVVVSGDTGRSPMVHNLEPDPSQTGLTKHWAI